MAGAGQGGPVRLAILLASLGGLAVLAVGTGGGLEGATASHTGAHGVSGKILATIARRHVPAAVRRQLSVPHPPGAGAIRVAGSTYLLGGRRPRPGGPGVPDPAVLRSVNGGPFSRVARLPLPVADPAVAVVGDRLYAIGGRLADGRASNEVEEYDIATERSVVAARLPEPVTDACALTMDGFVYVIGGRRNGAPSRAILRFDPWGNRVRRAGKLPVPATGGGGSAVRARRAYVVGASAPGDPRVAFAITLR
jgi:hypothetical protein